MRNDVYLKEIGSALRAMRKKKKITIRKMGELCDLDYGHISRLENGQYNPRLLTLKNMAEALGADLKRLV